MKPMKEFYEKQASELMKNLNRRNMDAFYCPDGASAVKKAMSLIRKGSTVSFGGSMTLTECGMMDALHSADIKLLDRARAKTPEETTDIYHQALSADYYLMSSNAVTLDGQLVNVDGNGNRVAALIYGPAQVILMVGMNKVVKDVDSAYKRIHTLTAPTNAMRLSLKTPCQASGVCRDCTSPDCICAQTVITRYSRAKGRITVILIGETLGY